MFEFSTLNDVLKKRNMLHGNSKRLKYMDKVDFLSTHNNESLVKDRFMYNNILI